MFAKRLAKEVQQLKTNPPPGVELLSVAGLQLLMGVAGSPNSLYDGESFLLSVKINEKYPMESPEVVFVARLDQNISVPIHSHVYSNGHICLDLLYDGWSPAITISNVCLSIISMLASATEKTPPDGNKQYVTMVGNASPKKTRWDFHDDKC